MLLQQFQAHWKRTFSSFTSGDSSFLLAVSGGIDSVVLLDLFSKSGIPFSIAHCNFTLRGEESERDETFVREITKRYNKELLVRRFDTEIFASQNKLSIQEAARKLRYTWFEELISNQRSAISTQPDTTSHQAPAISQQNITINDQLSTINYIVTAHHANDNIETLLINFFRGTGISGLHGILPKQNKIIRPMLFAKREEIKYYALENQLSWVEDSSNASDKYTRNFFRHRLVPLVKESFTHVEDNLLQNIQRFSEAEILYQQAVDTHKKKLIEIKGNEWHIPVLKLQKTKPLQTVLWEIVKDFQFTSHQLQDIQNLLTAENGKYVASVSHRIIRNRAWLVIAPQQTEEARHILIEENEQKIVYEGGVLVLKNIQQATINIQSATNDTALIDAKHIRYPLLLRKWKQGDYFYPLGMKKKKKLSKFFIDHKLSKTDKEKVWVIEMNMKVVWVVGYRIDDRFKVTDNTKGGLMIESKAHS